MPTASSRAERSPDREEFARFLALADQVPERFRPHVLLTYGGHPASLELMSPGSCGGSRSCFTCTISDSMTNGPLSTPGRQPSKTEIGADPAAPPPAVENRKRIRPRGSPRVRPRAPRASLRKRPTSWQASSWSAMVRGSKHIRTGLRVGSSMLLVGGRLNGCSTTRFAGDKIFITAYSVDNLVKTREIEVGLGLLSAQSDGEGGSGSPVGAGREGSTSTPPVGRWKPRCCPSVLGDHSRRGLIAWAVYSSCNGISS